MAVYSSAKLLASPSQALPSPAKPCRAVSMNGGL